MHPSLRHWDNTIPTCRMQTGLVSGWGRLRVSLLAASRHSFTEAKWIQSCLIPRGAVLAHCGRPTPKACMWSQGQQAGRQGCKFGRRGERCLNQAQKELHSWKSVKHRCQGELLWAPLTSKSAPPQAAQGSGAWRPPVCTTRGPEEMGGTGTQWGTVPHAEGWRAMVAHSGNGLVCEHPGYMSRALLAYLDSVTGSWHLLQQMEWYSLCTWL